VRSPNFIQVLLQVRSHREELEERRLTAIIEKLRLVESELAEISTELNCITSARLTEIQGILPNAHYQEVEAYSSSLWKRSADHAAEIEALRKAYVQQMSVYLSTRRDREVMESLDKQRTDALEAERNSREQKRDEDLFLAKLVANWDTLS
jgi:flagellar export protein FliJ